MKSRITSPNSHDPMWSVIAVVAAMAIAAGALILMARSSEPIKTLTPNPTSGPAAVFSGVMTDDGCLDPGPPPGDIGCSVTIDKTKSVFVMHGNAYTSQPWGSMLNFPQSLASPVGKRVEVYAQKLDARNFTLAGSTSYYVKVIN